MLRKSTKSKYLTWIQFVQESKQCFEEALERANIESEEDERYYKLIAVTIRLVNWMH